MSTGPRSHYAYPEGTIVTFYRNGVAVHKNTYWHDEDEQRSADSLLRFDINQWLDQHDDATVWIEEVSI